MFDWLKPKKPKEQFPEYAAIRKTPTRGLPPDLQAGESGEAHAARRAAIEQWLRAEPQLPREDAPLFTEFVAAGGSGMVTLELPDGSRCLPVFGSPARAFDYKRVHFAQGPDTSYLASTPVQLVSMLGKLRQIGITHFALDRCPRCSIVTLIDSASITSPEQAITCWIIARTGEMARMELYLDHARAAAQAGRRTVARDVALEAVAHVGCEDPRVHFLLGQIAVALEDRELLGEAKAFLRFLKHDGWEQKLDEIARSGSPDFNTT